MKTLENQFTQNDNNLTQIKRTDKAALYKRETLEGSLVHYEVFAIKTKNDSEIYPNSTAFGKWAWYQLNEDKVNVLFDRINEGVVTIMDVDPETGEVNRDENEMTYEQLMADETPIVETPVAVENVVETEIPVAVEIPVVVENTVFVNPVVVNEIVETVTETPVTNISETPISMEDPTTPNTPPVVVEAVVENKAPKAKKEKVVKAPKTVKTYQFPSGEWLRDDFAQLNGMMHHPSHSDSYGPLMQLIKSGKVVEVRKEKMGKGKPRSIYSVVVVAPVAESVVETAPEVEAVVASSEVVMA